ncbi:hypothetical protein BO71DRAFT_394468, partial [Aspergillus ellipticus CBS 707.79]
MAAHPSPDSNATSELQSSLRDLAIANKSPIKDIARPPTSTPAGPKKKKAAPVADSWEDEVDESASASEPEPASSSAAAATAAVGKSNASSRLDSPALSPSVRSAEEDPLDPPPTPISPQITPSQSWSPYGNNAGSPSGSRSPARRPEKQTAVAGRMIAGALGIRAPKRTEEQRAYDRAVKEQEIKRRNREREEAAKAKEDEEKVKAAVWD